MWHRRNLKALTGVAGSVILTTVASRGELRWQPTLGRPA